MTDHRVLKVSKEDYEALEGYTWFAMDANEVVFCYQDEPNRFCSDWGSAGGGIGQCKECNFPSNVTSKVLKMLQGEGWDTSLIKVEQAGKGEFTLDMLENGEHIVKTRVGKRYYFFGGKFFSEETGALRCPSEYKSDLSHAFLKDLDIVEVLTHKEPFRGLLVLSTIWSEPKKNQEALERIQRAEEELKAARAALEED